MELPSTEIINDKRIAKFKQRITDALANEDLSFFSQLVEQYQQEHNVPAIEISAALAQLLQGDTPLLLKHKPQRKSERIKDKDGKRTENSRNQRSPKKDEKRREKSGRNRKSNSNDKPDEGLERFRIEVGYQHNVKPGNIVGAIANEAGLESQFIGHIKIFDDFSLVDLPEGMPKEIFKDLKKVWVAGQQLRISRLDESVKILQRLP